MDFQFVLVVVAIVVAPYTMLGALTAFARLFFDIGKDVGQKGEKKK